MSLFDGLISHWPFNEPPGEPADDLHGSNTLASTPTVGSVAGKLGTARKFATGPGSVLSIDDNPSLSIVDDPLSIAVWPNLDNTDTLHAICGKYDGTFPGSEYLLFYSAASERFRFNVYDGLGGVASVDANSFGKPTPGVFNLVIAWHDPVANTINIRVNNGPVDSVPYSGGCHDGGNPFRLGVMPGLSADLAIDSLSVAKRVWTSDEHSFLWNNGAGRDYADFAPVTLRPRRNMTAPQTKAIGIDLTQITTNPNRSEIFALHDASRITLEVQASDPATAGSWVVKAVPAPDNTIDGQILVTTAFPADPADVSSETAEVAHMYGYVQQLTPIADATLQRVIVYKQ